MTGLKRGTLKLLPYQEEWAENAKNTIALLRNILGDTAIDIHHIGSTAVPHIHAKPIIDIAVGIRKPDDIIPYRETLEKIILFFVERIFPDSCSLLLVILKMISAPIISMLSCGKKVSGIIIYVFGII